MNTAEFRQYLLRARGADADALGRLLEAFRPYVRAIVRCRRDRRLQGRLGDSDLIQDALLTACRAFPDFRGETPAEWAAWLRRVVHSALRGAAREHLHAARRDAGSERPLEGLAESVDGAASSPSERAVRHEQSARLAEALARLPEDMQQVLLGRHADALPYAELAARLGRSEAAARVLYTRALRRLRDECGGGADCE